MYVRQNLFWLELLEQGGTSENDIANAARTLAVVDALRASAMSKGKQMRVDNGSF